MSKPKNAEHHANGEGCLVKRGKYWHARWMCKGKLYVKSTKCTNRKDAEKKLAELVQPFQTGNEIDALSFVKTKLEATAKENVPKTKPTKIRFLFDVMKNDINTSSLTSNTETCYETKITVFRKFCEKHDVEYAHQVTYELVEEFMKGIKKKNAEGTYNQYLVQFSKLFRVAMTVDNNIKYNPFSKLTKLKEDKSRTRRELTDEEVEAIFKLVDGKRNIDTKLMFYLAYYTGMRASDCASLQVGEIDWKKKMIRTLPIKTQKQGTRIIVPIHGKLFGLLKEKIEIRKNEIASDAESPRDHLVAEDYLMPLMKERLDKGQLSAFTTKIFNEVGIKTNEKDRNGKTHITCGLHSFRHMFASRCMKAGMSIKEVQVMLGHSNPMMSLHYEHVDESLLTLPNFDTKLVEVKIKKTSYEILQKEMQENESFEDCLERIIKHGRIDFEAIKKAEEERKAKERAEIEELLEGMFDENGMPIRESQAKIEDRGLEVGFVESKQERN